MGRIDTTPTAYPASYRPEIDGLRAIAVLAVVLFHARIRGFAGGFVGVDVFFVLSGYLIAGLILRESDAGSFTLIGFYERRVRRILPALLAMLGFAALAGWMLLPGDLRDFGQSLTAIALFASNLLFWQQDGYFSLTAAVTPLLHTWSLAVEEQFYIAFPALILVARHRRSNVPALLAALGLASFAYSAWAAQADPVAAFYSPLSRAWEFLAGALLATGFLPQPRRRLAGDTFAAIGLAAIFWAIWTLGSGTAFPGLNALAPVLGTALILHGTQAPGSRIAALLRVRPLVGIGLISYSLYLWHWPMMVFGSYYVLPPYGHVKPLMILLAFPVAWLSWRFVERPFRKPRLVLSRRALFATAIGASAALAFYGAAIVLGGGLPGRFDPVVQRLAERGPKPDYGCAGRPLASLPAVAQCRIGTAGAPPSFVLWGDSHASVLVPPLDALARRHGVAGYNATSLGCPPFLPVRPPADDGAGWMFREPNRRKCRLRDDEVMAFLARMRPAAVFLTARWNVYSRSGGPGDAAEDRRIFETGVARIRALGIAVHVMLDVPDAGNAYPETLAKAQILGRTGTLGMTPDAYRRRDAAFRAIAADLQRRGLITVLDPADRLCSNQRCEVIEGGYPLFYDNNHLSAHGAARVAPAFEPAIRALAGHAVAPAAPK